MASAAFSTEEAPATPWWLVLLEGVALIVVGLLLLLQTGITTVILVQILGIYWLVMGLVRIVSIFVDSAQWGWKLVAGALGIIAGVFVLRYPLSSTALVANIVIIVLGLTGIVVGLISLFQAFKGAGWGAGILGVVSIILGIVLLANVWLLTFSLPVAIGVLSIIGGIAAIFGAFRARREAAELAAAPDLEPVAAEATAVQVEAVAEEPVVEVKQVAEEAAVVAAVTEPEPEPEPVEPEVAAEEPVAEEAPALEHHALQHIEGIGPAYAGQLAAAGIDSTEMLLERGSTPAGRAAIADETGISGKLILTWVNHVDLMRVKGVGSQYADLLEEVGVDTVPDLARRNAANLYEAIVAVNQEESLVRQLPSQASVEGWVAEAKELPRIVQY